MRRELPQLHKKEGTTLVLSGGATKAFYFHLGVLKALGLDDVTSIVGTSAGAVAGALVATGVSVDTLIAAVYQKKVYNPRLDSIVKGINSRLLFKPRLRNFAAQGFFTSLEALRFVLSLPTLCNQDIVAEAIDRLFLSQHHVAGFFNADELQGLFKTLLPSNNFADTDIDLYVTATSLDSHERVVFNGIYDFTDAHNIFMRDVPIHKAVRASTSLPGMFEPVKIKGRYYVDGEIKQTLSMDIGLALSDHVIVSHTYQPLYRSLESAPSVGEMGWVTILKQSLHIILHERMMVWRDIYEHQYPDKQMIWITPDPDDLEFFLAPEFSFRPEVQKRIIKSGEAAAHRALEQAAAQGG